MRKQYIVSFDQGTTSSRCIVYNAQKEEVSRGQMPFEQFFPNSGWVEHDPEEMFNKLVKLMGVITGLFFSVSVLHRSFQGKRQTNTFSN